ncbi:MULTISPECIES: hypothetical protein [Silvimonas]|uniref:hypothetical protein n=1 Tax=Silvimonas TaxID=300264 RepID=UPI0024B3B929|nr:MULTISPECIES: hypothetical protein [Silvimonas]MDR3427294.1 hypothetical protein [Silvimonas sp.]
MKPLLLMLLVANLTGCVVVPAGPPPRVAYIRPAVVVAPAPVYVAPGPCCWRRW